MVSKVWMSQSLGEIKAMRVFWKMKSIKTILSQVRNYRKWISTSQMTTVLIRFNSSDRDKIASKARALTASTGVCVREEKDWLLHDENFVFQLCWFAILILPRVAYWNLQRLLQSDLDFAWDLFTHRRYYFYNPSLEWIQRYTSMHSAGIHLCTSQCRQ